jgi:hypothetical protein
MTSSRGSIPPGYGAAIVTWWTSKSSTVDPPKGNGLGPQKNWSSLNHVMLLVLVFTMPRCLIVSTLCSLMNLP